MDYSLEDILAEYRAWEAANGTQERSVSPVPDVPAEPEPAAWEEPVPEEREEPAPAPAPDTEEPAPAPAAKGPAPAPPKADRDERPAPLFTAERMEALEDELLPVRKKHPAPLPQRPSWPPRHVSKEDLHISEEEMFGEMFTPEELRRAETQAEEEAARLSAAAQQAASVSEGDEEDDEFFTGAAEKPAEAGGEPEDTPEGGEEGEGAGHRLSSRERDPERAHRAVDSLLDKAAARLSGVSRKRNRRRAQRLSAPETVANEMPAGQAARYYGSCAPALRLRTMAAGALCLLMLWIAVGSALGAGIPWRLAENVRTATLVSLVAGITVLILGLDVLTSGFLSAFRGYPGAESLIALASVAAALDSVLVISSGGGERGIPYLSAAACSVFFALWGAWRSAEGFHDTFFTIYHNPEPTVVVREEVPGRKGSLLRKLRKDPKGFLSRCETPSIAERMASSLFFPVLLGSAVLALIFCAVTKSVGSFLHAFSLLTALGASFGWLFSFPVLFAGEAKRLMLLGCAAAGWAGAADSGAQDTRLLLEDTDIFPADAVEIVGIRLLDKERAAEIVSVTGSMLSRAGAGTSAVFLELMRRNGAEPQEVEEFMPGEGGYRGVIGGSRVRVGTVGYMHLSGVKIPDKLRAENAVYTAVDNTLAGVFLLRYRPLASVHEALRTLRRERRKPVFAGKDFNLDPQLLRRRFGVSPEGFEFPPLPDRCALTDGLTGETTAVVGILPEDTMEPFVELTESCRRLSVWGRVCAWCCVLSMLIGAVLFLAVCAKGGWTAAASWKLTLYMLAWLLPTLILRLLRRRA